MRQYQPQVSYTEEPELAGFLNREYGKVALSLNTVQELKIETILPTRPTVGKIYFFEHAINGVIDEEGYYGYKSTGYVKLG